MKTKLYLSVLMCFGLSSCQVVTETLSSVNGVLSSVNSALSGTAVTSAAQSSVDSAVNRAKASQDAKILFNQAKPAISKYVALIACNTPDKAISSI
ncbi:hypothetical protein V6W59_08695 [Mannheimia sp. HC-2023]|uniref:Lipoprotein n=1 Tax=Mannheimia indoligenes TaxID=3103145 RepID=A0ABU7ZEN7_9PAST